MVKLVIPQQEVDVAVVGTIVVELPTLLRWAASGGISQAADGTPLEVTKPSAIFGSLKVFRFTKYGLPEGCTA
jgi:hypothetical protein